jgi:hypothetical protein
MPNDNVGVNSKQPLYHVGDLVIFSLPGIGIAESIGLVEFVDEDFLGEPYYGVIGDEKTYILRQPFIVGLAYK